jgi:hypothetical protein
VVTVTLIRLLPVPVLVLVRVSLRYCGHSVVKRTETCEYLLHYCLVESVVVRQDLLVCLSLEY